MDPLDLVALARSLVDIDSTTGREADCGPWLAAYLRYLGWTVEEQEVSGGRSTCIATLDPPSVVFSTHFDCVPPFFPSRVEGGRLHGRGSGDAKGILAAQLHAAERLRAAGERRVGMLFVVGEERGSDGAKTANTHPMAEACRFLVNGEPTSNQLGKAHRGVLRVRMIASGRAAHTSRPEKGESAIDKLIDTLVELRAQALPEDPLLGKTLLHDRADLGRRRPERHPCARGSGSDVSYRRPARRSGAGAGCRCVHASRSRPSSKCPP